MPASQDNITAATPMGATILPEGGVTFRVWAPAALAVYVSGDFNGWTQDESCQLVEDGQGIWTGFIGSIGDGAAYKFFIQGTGSTGFKRDPYARELTFDPAFPASNCLVRSPDCYPWHDQGFQMPAFNDLVVYQLHIGTYYGTDATGTDNSAGRVCTFLDVIDRLPYLVELGINAARAIADRRIPDRYERGLQRDRLLLTREPVRDRPRARARPVCRQGQPAPPRRGCAPFRRARSTPRPIS